MNRSSGVRSTCATGLSCHNLCLLDLKAQQQNQHRDISPTLVLICPDVDTFRMSFWAPSCSASLSEDSSAALELATAPTTWAWTPVAHDPGSGWSGSCGSKQPTLAMIPVPPLLRRTRGAEPPGGVLPLRHLPAPRLEGQILRTDRLTSTQGTESPHPPWSRSWLMTVWHKH